MDGNREVAVYFHGATYQVPVDIKWMYLRCDGMICGFAEAPTVLGMIVSLRGVRELFPAPRFLKERLGAFFTEASSLIRVQDYIMEPPPIIPMRSRLYLSDGEIPDDCTRDMQQ